MSGLNELDPVVAMAEQQIAQQRLRPDQAVTFLLSKGVDPRLASLVMKYRALKQDIGQGGGQPPQQQPQPTVADDINNRLNAMQGGRNAGVAQLPVPNQMFGGQPQQGMAGGGLVSFAGDDGSYVEQAGQYIGGIGRNLRHPVQWAYDTGQGMYESLGSGLGHIVDPVDPVFSAIDKAGSRFGQGIVSGYTGQPMPQQAQQPPVTPLAAQPRPQPPAPQGVAPPDFMKMAHPDGQAPPLAQPSPAQVQANQIDAAARISGGIGGGGGAGVLAAQQEQFAKQNALVEQQAPHSVQWHYNNLDNMAKEQGIGNAAKEHLSYLDSLEGQLQQYKKQNNWGALAQAGFAMAQAATTNPHGGFLGALAVGGEKGAQAFQQNMDKYRDLSMRLNDQRYQVEQSLENFKNDRTKESLQEHNNEVTHYDSLLARTQAAQDAAASRTMTREIAAMTVGMQAKYRALFDPKQLIMEDIQKYPVGSAQYDAAIRKLTDIGKTQPGVQAADIRANAAIDAKRAATYNSLPYQQLMMTANSNNPKRAAEAQEQLDKIERSFGPNQPQVAGPIAGVDLSQWGTPRIK